MLGSDDTTKMPTVEATPPDPAPGTGAAAPPLGAAAPPSDASPPAPSAAWSPPPALPPAWQPPRTERDRTAPLVIGLLFLLVGLWFFATQTLGLDLPRLDWNRLWPLILIVIGVLIVLRAFGRAR